MKFYNFANGVDENELFYAYSPQSRTSNKFICENGYIRNSEMPIEEGAKRGYHDYEHISLLTKEKYGEGTTITLDCDFKEMGAPLILLTNELISLKGLQSYDRHIEVVVYDKGINVWDIVYAPDKPERRFIAPKKIAFKTFNIENGERVTVSTKILNGALYIECKGEELTVEIPNLDKELYVGLTACEGINKFYSLKIE